MSASNPRVAGIPCRFGRYYQPYPMAQTRFIVVKWSYGRQVRSRLWRHWRSWQFRQCNRVRGGKHHGQRQLRRGRARRYDSYRDSRANLAEKNNATAPTLGQFVNVQAAGSATAAPEFQSSGTRADALGRIIEWVSPNMRVQFDFGGQPVNA